MSEERLKLIKLIEENPAITQRELAQALGVSVGKTNYLIKALVEKGLVKMRNFKSSDNKARYLYYLTPKGMEEKVRLTYHFLRRKTEEYERLQREIEALRKDLKEMEETPSQGTGENL